MSRNRRTPADEPFLVVRTLGGEVAGGTEMARHAHQGWDQLIYCAAGVMTVWTDDGAWVAPPHWAVWAPAGVGHRIRFAGAAAFRTLYLRADLGEGLPRTCAVVAVSPLLRELVLRAVALEMLDVRAPAQAAMAQLIVAEFAARPVAPLELPMPTSPAARRAAERLAQGVEGRGVDGRGVDGRGVEGGGGTARLAAEVGLGPRTLERRFLAETGLSVAEWGRQARLQHSLRLLAAGEPVKTVAQAAGYATPSAFVAAFRKAFGRTPARYFTRTA